MNLNLSGFRTDDIFGKRCHLFCLNSAFMRRRITIPWAFAAFAIASLCLSAAGCSGSVPVDPDYEKEVMDFRERRVKYLKSEKGYLNIVGLFWLKEGDNSFGSGLDNDFHFPSAFPENFGTATMSGEIVTFIYTEAVDLKGEEVTSAAVDVTDKSQVFARGPFRWFILESGGNYAIRIRNFNSPVLDEPLDLKFYDVAPVWRITGKYTAYDKAQSRTITNIRDIQYEQDAPGMIIFERNGKSYSFEPRFTSDGMSVIFMDETTGNETFSGGRFLLMEEPDKDGNIILDFNKALNFPCAYNAYTTCPIPPERNRLALAVSAGEKAPSHTDNLP